MSITNVDLIINKLLDVLKKAFHLKRILIY